MRSGWNYCHLGCYWQSSLLVWTHRVKQAEIKHKKTHCWGWKCTHSSGKCKGNTPLLLSSTLGTLWLRSPWWTSAPTSSLSHSSSHNLPCSVSLCPAGYLPWPGATSDSDSELTGVSHQESMLMFVMKKHLPPPRIWVPSLFSSRAGILLSVFIFTAEGVS